MEERLLTCEDVASYLRLTPKTIRNWVSMGKIPHTKVNGSVRFVRSRIDLWLTEREVREVR